MCVCFSNVCVFKSKKKKKREHIKKYTNMQMENNLL